MKDDTRRIIDGIRLHPFVGLMLYNGVSEIRAQNPGKKLTNLDFCRSAIAQLGKLNLIYKIEARVVLPRGLDDRTARLAKRQRGTPMWVLTDQLADKWSTIWSELSPSLKGGIVWQP